MGETISWQDVFDQANGKKRHTSEKSSERSSQKRGGGNGGGGGGPQWPGMPDFDFSRFMNKTKRFWIALVIALLLVAAFSYWWFHPAINIHSSDLWWFLVVFICIPAFMIFFILSRTSAKKGETNISYQKRSRAFRRLMWVPVAVVAIGIIGALLSATFFPFNAQKYASVLQTDEYDFATDIEEVDYTQIPVIDHDSAVILGNRALGSIPDYVSQFEISNLYSQINYNDTPVRVSPLGYADFFKWITNRDPGIPAYVLVDMTTQDTQVVRLDEAMKYSQSEPFFRNIDRYVQLRYPFYMFEQLAFEVDDEGHPWWVCPVQKRTIGLFGGETIQRVVLVDACTGDTQDFAIEDCPQWVDRAYPSELLVTQYNWSGRYINGWWNSWLGQNGVKQTTPGTDGQLGYNYIAKDDDVWVYTGVTSATGDNSIIGFVLINQRTAESHFYSVAGATEDSAMSSAEGQVQHLKYKATFPLLLNINGQPTYFMALKDDAGLVKQYAMLDIQRYQNVAIGDTVSACQDSYKALLTSNGVVVEDDTLDSATRAEGTVTRVATAVIDGNSHFYITLEGDPNIYDCELPALISAVTIQTGDSVSMRYIEGTPTYKVIELSVNGSAAEEAPVETTGTGSTSDSTVASAESTSADTASAAAPTTTGTGTDGSISVVTEGSS